MKITPRSSVLHEAHELVHGERNAHYGSPTENFSNIAALWNVQVGHKLKDGEGFTPTEVAVMLTHLKLARIIASPGKRDHYVDGCGYLALAWECEEDAEAA